MAGLQKHTVASGSYFLGRTNSILLQAFLGTCVGVAIYDTASGMGGLLHLLLPEPVSSESSVCPQRYASTGLPLFIQALYEKGARPKTLKACVAGGALVGPLSEQDLAFDIGGRTADVVRNLLAQEKIPVEKSETGGFFTCCLSLNMQTWKSSIDPSGQDRLPKKYDIHVPLPKEISRAIKGLQPIPQVALKILRIIKENDYDVADIAEQVRKDQVLSARTLQLCNSVVFARQKKIESLESALVILGRDILVKSIISVSVQKYFHQSGMGYSLCKGGMYHHAVGTAIIADKLATFTGKVQPSLAYTAGLLHDIGKVVLDQYVASAYPLFYRGLHEQEKHFLEIEKKFLGTDHTQIGADLAEKWAFPESLVDVIRHHHAPENADRHPELTHIVYLADLLMSRFHTGLEMDYLETESLASRLEKIGLSISRFSEIVDLIPDEALGFSPEQALYKG